MRYPDTLHRQLLRRAETVLRPSLAILIECALESERNSLAAEHLSCLSAHFHRCAEAGAPLAGDKYEPFIMFSACGPDEAELVSVGLLSEDSLTRETSMPSVLEPEDSGFSALIADSALELDITELAPLVLGVGIADTEDESRMLARLALFRSPDKPSPDGRTAECERRILARLNNKGPGAGGLGGNHTALAVSVERTGAGYITLLPGSCFTRLASAVLDRSMF